MSHIDPDDLANLALGESSASADQDAHLAVCAACADELSELERVVQAARRMPDAELSAPAPAVWDAIAREIGETPAAAVDLAATPEGDAHAAPTHSTARHDVGRGTRSRPRLRQRLLLATAGFATALAAVVLVVTLTAPRPVDVATATLDAFPDHPGAAGSAALEREPDGTERIVVDLEADLPDDGFREVWLLKADGSALVSLGVLEGREGTFTIPADVDTAQYSVVDISQEPEDGDATHSGDSIVRGQLERS